MPSQRTPWIVSIFLLAPMKAFAGELSVRSREGERQLLARAWRSLIMLAWLLPCLVFIFPPVPAKAAAGEAAARAAVARLPWERVQQSPPGSWVELALLVGGVPAGPHLRFLILEREARGSWIELWISQGPGSGSLAYQLLVDVDAKGRLAIRRLLSRALGGPVQELPVDHLAPAPASRQAELQGASWQKEEGPTLLLTPAGSFQTRAASLRQGRRILARVWRCPEIPVFGLARIESAEGLFALEVSAFGSEAAPLIPPSARPSEPAPGAP